MKIRDLGEFGLIERLASALKDEHPDLVKGIGDDTAVIKVSDDRYWLATCDAQVENIHFVKKQITGFSLGRRIGAVNLSDIAAMGGSPCWALISLFVPDQMDVSYLDELYRGLQEILEQAGVLLVGGNTVKSESSLMVDLFLLGEVSPNCLLTRGGAVPRDILCVTGTLGEAAAGLEVAAGTSPKVRRETRDRVLSRHFTPTPRIDAGRMLGHFTAVSACIDISDGLVQDAGHLAKQSGVSIEINANKLPISDHTRMVAEVTGKNPTIWALSGGEDFELLFTVQENAVSKIQNQLDKEIGLSVTPIGVVREGEPSVNVVDGNGNLAQISMGGFDHLKKIEKGRVE